MSEGLLDIEGWRRSIGPAVKVTGYTAAIYLLMYLFVILPVWFLVNFFGAPEQLWSQFTIPVVTVLMVFSFVMAIFKVLDELR